MFTNKKVPVISTAGGSTMITSALEHYLWSRRQRVEGVHFVHTSDGLRVQGDRVQIQGDAPEPTPAAGGKPEYFDAIYAGVKFRVIASGIEIFKDQLAVDHDHLRRQLHDDPVIVVDDPWQHYESARHSVRARAYFLQERLGKSAADALIRSFEQHFDRQGDEIRKNAPRLGELLDTLAAASWGFDIIADDPWKRYPLDGGNVNEIDFNRALDDAIQTFTRRSDRTRDILRQVLPTVPRVIITFKRLDWQTSLPGVRFDPIALANELAPARPGVSIVTGKYVDHRLESGECLERFEGFSAEGPGQLWVTLADALGKPTSTRAALPESVWSRCAIIAGASLLLVVIFAMLIGFANVMATIGVLTMIAQIALIGWCVWKSLPTPRTEPKPEARREEKAPPVEQPKQKDLPDALAERNKFAMNGHAEHAHR